MHGKKCAILLTVHKAKDGVATEYISDLLKPQRSTHNMAQKSTKQDLLAVSKHNQRLVDIVHFFIHAPQLWNNLPQDIKVKTNMDSFKSH